MIFILNEGLGEFALIFSLLFDTMTILGANRADATEENEWRQLKGVEYLARV